MFDLPLSIARIDSENGTISANLQVEIICKRNE